MANLLPFIEIHLAGIRALVLAGMPLAAAALRAKCTGDARAGGPEIM